jgi:RNA polymerase sigma-70 factor, ECF subfamily
MAHPGFNALVALVRLAAVTVYLRPVSGPIVEANEPDQNEEIGGLSQTDRSLVVMVRSGDEDAAYELYDRYARRVFGLVKSKMGARLATATDPDDIVQSVFKSAFRGMKSGHYEAPEGATLWNLLAVIAVRKLSNKANHHSAECRDINRKVSIESDLLVMSDDQASIEFLELCVRETLELLRLGDREILSLRIQNHNVNEISEITGRSRRSIERSLQRSRQRLADVLLNEEK